MAISGVGVLPTYACDTSLQNVTQDLNYALELYGKGLAFEEKDNHAEAEACFRKAREIRREKLGSDHLDVAQCEVKLGISLGRQGKSVDAEVCFRRAVEIHKGEPD